MPLGADGDVNRFVFLIEQVIDGQIRTQGRAGLYFDTHVGYDFNIFVQNLSWKPVFGDADSEHAAGLGESFVYNRFNTFNCKLVGGGKAGRP